MRHKSHSGNCLPARWNDAFQRKWIVSSIILHGLIHRSLRHTVESFRECVIEPLARLGPVDVFFHSWDVAEVNNPRAGEAGETLDEAEVARCLPEARGLFESQEAFDASVDWERLFRNNPMRRCCGNEVEARATLMNFRRALESQERAWRVFEERKTKHYDLVVATRADLRFLEEVGISNIERSTSNVEGGRIWVPKFHSWGGVNDRFAIGNEEGVRTWSQRVAFAEEWLERAKGESAEWLLMKWLEKRRVRVGFLDFTFQRIRANGQVAERDRDLNACGKKEGMRASPLLKERFLILARETGARADGLRKVLEPLGRVEMVVDRENVAGNHVGTGCPDDGLGQIVPATVWVPDKEAEGFGGLMGRTTDFPPVTAWSRALAHLEGTLQEDEAVWLVEDDVAGDAESFARLVELTRAEDPDLAARDIRTKDEDPEWYFWDRAEGFFERPARAFQPLCRLSARLLREALRFRETRGALVFHEILFASLARRDGMELLDWGNDPECGACFSTFVYRPEVTRISRGIAHPVKDMISHGAICAIPPAGLPRMGRAKLDGWSILSDDYLFLAKFCRAHGIRRVAEFGPGDSTLALLDAGCRVVAYEHDIGWLRHSVEHLGCEDAVEIVHCPEGHVPDAPPFEPDLVFVDGPPYREGQSLSRLAPCEWALETCGCFLLHDACRHGELATLEEMELRGMQVVRIPTRKGMALVVDPDKKPGWASLMEIGNHFHADSSGHPWMPDEWFVWSVLFRENSKSLRILQCGAADGLRARLLLDQVFTHPESEVHAIECYEGEAGGRMRETFESHAREGGHTERIHLYEGTTREALAWMISGDGFWESFDFIHLNRAAEISEWLADACQAWCLLKPGGVLGMPKHGPQAAAADAFLRIYSDRLEKVIESRWIAVTKRR